MLGHLRLGFRAANVAFRVDQIDGIEQFSALVALVTTSVIELTVRASAVHISISQEPECHRLLVEIKRCEGRGAAHLLHLSQ